MESTVTKISPSTWKNIQSESQFIVATFNTLRKGYDFSKKYWVSEQGRTWEYRLSLHKNVLSSLNADILCLQEAEVATFEQDFGFLSSIGYTAINPVAKDEEGGSIHGHTKPSMFFRTSRFKLKWHNPRTRVVVANFEDLKTGKSVYIINCHLQAGEEQAQRCFQLRSALQQMILHAKNEKVKDEDMRCVLCGDFNSPSSEPVHKLILKGSLDGEDIGRYFGKSAFKFKHNFKFEDCHEMTDRPYTFKWGVKEDALFGVFDYVYCTPNTLKRVAIRDPLDEQQKSDVQDKIGIPNDWHPSDHLPVAALFEYC